MCNIIVYIFAVLLTIGDTYADERDIKLDRIERKTDIADIKTQDQEIKNSHHTYIARAHPDYEKIAYGTKFPEYISRLPSTRERRKRTKDIILSGTSDEIISLLFSYKNERIPSILKEQKAVTQIQNNKRKLGMLNKKEIINLVDKFVKNDKIIYMEYQEKRIRKGTIEKAHPDYGATINDPKFYEYINNLPEEHKKTAEAILESGSAEEVLALLSTYKKDSRIKESTVYKENMHQTTYNTLKTPINAPTKTHSVGEIVKLRNPSDSCVGFYKDPSLKEITSLFANGVKAKVLEVKDYGIYKVQVSEKVGWVSVNDIK